MFSYIDTAGVSQLKTTVLEYESIGIKTYLAGVAVHVDRMLHKDNFYKEVRVFAPAVVVRCATALFLRRSVMVIFAAARFR